MKFACLALISSLLVVSALTQDLRLVDSLTRALSDSKADTSKVGILLQLSNGYISSSPEQAIQYGIQARDLAQKLHFKSGKAFALKNIGMVYYNQTKYPETFDYWNQSYLLFDSVGDKANMALLLNNIGSVYMNQGDDSKALEYYFRSLQIAEQSGDKHKISIALANIGTLYANNKFTYGKALEYFLRALALNEQLGDKNVMGGLLVNIGETYLNRDEDDSALYYFERSLEAYKNTENIPYSLNDIGTTYTKKGNYALAKQYHEKAIAFAMKHDLKLDIAQSHVGLGDAYYKMRNYPEAIIAYKTAKTTASDFNLKKELKNACFGLTMSYAALKDFSNAFKYQSEYINIKDTLFNIEIAQKVSSLQSGFEIQKQNQIDILTKDKALQQLQLERQTFARNTLIAGLVAFFIIAFILFILYRQLGSRTALLTRSLEELKSTQAQLIQSEKMASLGELTAGIAHEIQNPLNFVNNFSEVNTELLEELEQGILDGNFDDLKSIANNIKQNEQKINHHGKRADAIVKGMLLHSRTSNGKKEPSDINALADEYLRFAFYGFRTKDKTFNPTMDTDFDRTIGNIFIVQQDIGRVLLNLYNNAFYAVYERMKKQPGGYIAKVSVRTKKTTNRIDIIVTDNGIGIPQRLMDKIFQPFFTTKPAGEGTGLGLSLSYDIVKAHGGEINAMSEEEGQTIFKVTIPLNSS